MNKENPPVIKFIIGNKYYMIERDLMLLKSDYEEGYYGRIQSIFNFFDRLSEQDFMDLEEFLTIYSGGENKNV